MRKQFRNLMDICKLLLIFVTLTFIFYGVIVWINDKIEPQHRYEEPRGRAVKVVQMEEESTLLYDFKERLLLFYQIGE